MASFPYESVTHPQSLELTFELSKLRRGTVSVSVETNENPEQYGCDLLFPNLPPNSDDQSKSPFTGFPACTAAVRSTGAKGYGAMYGWIQLCQIKNDAVLKPDDPWEMDPVPITSDLNTPFVWFGENPTLFDAPMRQGIKKIDWKCHSFLAGIDDCMMSKDVRPILGFEWGFWIDEGKVSVKPLREVKLDAWEEHLPLLREKFEGWKFRDREGRSE